MHIFVTGTDTGVGKTVVTALCLAHLQAAGVRVRALKPFCSGERNDAVLLWELQDRQITLDEVNPFFFPMPIAPWTAAQASGQRITLDQTLARIRRQSNDGDVVLIEGAGGLLAPLGDLFSAADLIRELRSEVIVVAANRIGVLNHALLTIEALAARNVDRVKIALSEGGMEDESTKTNEADLRRLIGHIPLFKIPHLGDGLAQADSYRSAAVRLAKELEALVSCGSASNP